MGYLDPENIVERLKKYYNHYLTIYTQLSKGEEGPEHKIHKAKVRCYERIVRELNEVQEVKRTALLDIAERLMITVQTTARVDDGETVRPICADAVRLLQDCAAWLYNPYRGCPWYARETLQGF